MKNPGTVALAAIIDVALILVFVLIGRGSHNEDVDAQGTLLTLWPFLVGVVLGWVLTFAWLRPLAVTWPGIPLWIITVAAAMLLRESTGQGVQFSFVVVATLVLGVFLVGWRLLALAVVHRRALSTAEATEASGE